MEWYWIVLLAFSGIGIGFLVFYLVFLYAFTNGFKDWGL